MGQLTPFGYEKATTKFIIPIILLLTLFNQVQTEEQHIPLQNQTQATPSNNNTNNISKLPKLLILVLDGARWDALEQHKKYLHGFHEFLSEGVSVEYVEPIFPSLAFPSWTSLVTGLYPSSHKILGNFMLTREGRGKNDTIFNIQDSNSTRSPFWWRSCEPLWTTATKAGHKVLVSNFHVCDVPFDGVLPAECVKFVFAEEEFKLGRNLNKVTNRFLNGFNLAIVHEPAIDIAGHEHGPESDEVRVAFTKVDAFLREFLLHLKAKGLDDVNIVIVSTNGMTNLLEEKGIMYVKISDYANAKYIYKVVDYGAVVGVLAKPGKTDKLFKQLNKMTGITIFKKADIPHGLNYTDSDNELAPDILLVATAGYSIVGLKGKKQLPQTAAAASVAPYYGGHGYLRNLTDMRGMLIAKGPAFKKGLEHGGISLVDVYQIFTKVLGLKPSPHNGTWEHVKDIFT